LSHTIRLNKACHLIGLTHSISFTEGVFITMSEKIDNYAVRYYEVMEYILGGKEVTPDLLGFSPEQVVWSQEQWSSTTQEAFRLYLNGLRVKYGFSQGEGRVALLDNGAETYALPKDFAQRYLSTKV